MTIRAYEEKCCACKKERVVAWWPCNDIGIPMRPYCRACLTKVQTAVFIRLSKHEGMITTGKSLKKTNGRRMKNGKA